MAWIGSARLPLLVPSLSDLAPETARESSLPGMSRRLADDWGAVLPALWPSLFPRCRAGSLWPMPIRGSEFPPGQVALPLRRRGSPKPSPHEVRGKAATRFGSRNPRGSAVAREWTTHVTERRRPRSLVASSSPPPRLQPGIHRCPRRRQAGSCADATSSSSQSGGAAAAVRPVGPWTAGQRGRCVSSAASPLSARCRRTARGRRIHDGGDCQRRCQGTSRGGSWGRGRLDPGKGPLTDPTTMAGLNAFFALSRMYL